MKMKTLLSFLFVISYFFLFARLTQAQVTPQPWGGACTDNGQANGVATIQGFECLIANVLRVAVTAIGLIGFVMLIVGAFRYLVSGGNAKGTEGGRNTITFAVIGLVVALSAYIILNLIADFTGVKAILNFQIPNAHTTF